MSRQTAYMPGPRPRTAGFTMVELLVVVAVVSILALLAAPSFNDFIRLQRLKGVTSQLMTDLQFARTEAATRNQPVRVRFNESDVVSCYTIYTGPAGVCRCTNAPVCAAGGTEVRTVAVPRRQAVRVVIPTIPDIQRVTTFDIDPATGGILIPPSDARGDPPDQFVIDTQIDNSRRYRVEVKLSGRPGTCKPAGSTMDAPAC